MKRIHTGIIVLALPALLSACAREAVPPHEAASPIAFSVQVEAADMTKGTAGTLDAASLKGGDGFGVFACYTGIYNYRERSVSANFMHNQQVFWQASPGVWTYDPVKYWPNGEGEATEGAAGTDIPHRVSFFAYAPYSEGDTSTPEGYCIPSTVYPTEESDPWILYRLHPDVSEQVDLLCAVPQLNLTKGGVADKIEFRFLHALACVGNTFTVRPSSALQTQLKNTVDAGIIGADEVRLHLTDLSVTYTLTQKARLVLWNQGQPNWQPVLSEDAMTTRTRTLLSGAGVTLYSYDGSSENETPWSDTGNNGILFIPLEVGSGRQKATVTLHYTLSFLSGGAAVEERSETAQADIILLDAGYEAGKNLSVSVTLSPLR